MSIPLRLLWLSLCAILSIPGQSTPSVGSGVAAPIQTRFQLAFLRGNFKAIVSQPPVADVHSFGTTGLIQEFYDTAKTAGIRAALVLADQSKLGFDGDVLQVFPDIYTYYTAVGVNTAGYPIEDTQACPGVPQCTFQRFTKSYALFAFPAGNPNGTQFTVSGAFFTKWSALNAVSGPLGIVLDSVKTVTSSLKTTASYQTFAGGTLYGLTSGTNSGQTFSVLAATNTFYQNLGGPTGILGLPLGDEVTLAGGIQRQLFEGGRVQYPTGGNPILLLPLNEIRIDPLGPVSLKSGQTVTLTERAYDASGTEAVGRTVSWSTTNGQVVSIQTTGNVAVVKGLGSGNALVTATSEGKVSTAVLITVSAPCCGVGEGAPSLAISQTFQDAVARNRLTVQIPGPNPVLRASTGYTQDLLSTDGTTHFLIAKGDRSGTAYLIAGALLAPYLQSGGPAGSLGFPVSDANPAGTQLFEYGALAGTPVRSVSGAILPKWAALKYDAGIAGIPTGAAVSFTTVSGYSGQAQQFSGGMIYGISTGNRAGQGFFVSGAILSRYLVLAGPAGLMGLPLADALLTGSVQRQNFENGYIDWSGGAAAAQEHLVPRTPTITANPSSALAGSRLHLTVGGFADGSTLKVSVAGQPDFTVKTQNGSYEWDLLIDSTARSSSVAIHAVDVATGTAADGSYLVKTIADAKPDLTKTAGDNQTGTPGSLLPVRLAVILKDGSGTPLAGVTVSFSASPGGQVSPSSVATDASGVASTSFRLPSSAGLAAVTAASLGKLAIFNARAAGSSSSSFPQFTQASGTGALGNGTDLVADKGALLTAVAAVLRFYQNQGLLAAPNGLADPNSLNQFLKGYCAPGTRTCDGFVSSAGSSEQIVNLWRVGAFVGGNVIPSVENPDLGAVRDLVGSGSPIVLSLALQQDGIAAGGATVVATGISADGSLQIYDPNPSFSRTSLADYLAGFTDAGHVWKATVLSALRFLPGQPSSTGFVLASIAQLSAALPGVMAQTATGSCGKAFLVQNAASVSSSPSGSISTSEFLYCDGTQPLYLATFTSSGPFSAFVTDLGVAGGTQDLSSSGSAGYQITRAPAFTVSAPAVTFAASGVVNAASFQPSLAPGEIVSIFGSGLSGPGFTTQVSFGGTVAQVLTATAFQINAQVPPSAGPGPSTLQIRSAYGSSERPVTLEATAPGIFVLNTTVEGAAEGAVINQSGSLNSSALPAKRGETVVIYGTGFGAVGGTATTLVPVTAVLAGLELPVTYAGLTPGFVGLYQVNLPIPVATPPGLFLSLTLRQAAAESNSVLLAIQ